ncbi:helix-turn-helix transcriptional regulator [Sporolactobacillus sp. STCC-11]|uniref:helix-turn-helix domain-containing protein n=1 Tax=Sporolactobacillus caesalpiniae TaxID=3230362 RepID=UPI003394AA2A
MHVKPQLKKILKEKGLTQEDLSRLSSIPQGTISRFDNQVKHPDNTLFRISRALNLSIEDLFEVIEDANDDN